MQDFSFWSVLTLVQLLLLITGICALAVWATRAQTPSLNSLTS